MSKNKKTQDDALSISWALPAAATLGSSIRAKGILLEIRAHLPVTARNALDLEMGSLVLTMDKGMDHALQAISKLVSKALETIEDLPVIPREIEDILTISTTERHRWLADGRLPSAGTRTVRLRGRAKRITFHVFDPRVVEDLLNRGAADEWREEDAAAAVENRRRAALKAKLTRSLRKKTGKKPLSAGNSDETSVDLSGWEEFTRDGLLR